MASRIVIFVTLFFALSLAVSAQQVVDPANRYYRLICLVHITGNGQQDGGILPEFVRDGVETAKAAAEASALKAITDEPAKRVAEQAARNLNTATARSKFAEPPPGTPRPDVFKAARPGILGWSMQKTDDGQMAIVYLVAADHHAFDEILADKRPELRTFEIGKDSRENIEAELRKFKKDFDLASFRVMVP